jgi:hypothetical protein
MARANACQSQLRRSVPKLGMWPARRAGTSTKEADVAWLWINIPLMAVFFLAMTGIPLWLVFKHPDRSPAREGQGGHDAGRADDQRVPGRPVPAAAQRYRPA